MHIEINGTLDGGREVDCEIDLYRHDGVYWRFCPRAFPIDSTHDTAPRDGRYNRAGQDGCWYGAACATGAWGELMRHSSPSLRSRDWQARAWHFGSVRFCSIYIADLTDDTTLSRLGVEWEQLRSNDWTLTQRLSDLLWKHERVDAILAPGAPLQGHRILVVRRGVLPSRKCAEIVFEATKPPTYMDHLAEQIRLTLSATPYADGPSDN